MARVSEGSGKNGVSIVMKKSEERKKKKMYHSTITDWENYTEWMNKKSDIIFQVHGVFWYVNIHGKRESQNGFSYLHKAPISSNTIQIMIDEAEFDAGCQFNATEEAGEEDRYEDYPDEWFFDSVDYVEVYAWRLRSPKRPPKDINLLKVRNMPKTKKGKKEAAIAEAERKFKQAEVERIKEYAKTKRKIRRQEKKKKSKK